MSEHRFILEPYKTPASRYTCPSCGKHKQFTRYINVETNEHLSSEVGKCNRDINCGYHYTPKQYFQDNPNVTLSLSKGAITQPVSSLRGTKQSFPIAKQNISKTQTATAAATATIPPQLFKQSLSHYHANNFTHFLTNLFGSEITSTLITKYYIGTSKHWNGSTVFWQIDTDKKIRTGKIMLYNPTTGKRVKQPFNHITWVHTLLMKQNQTPLCAPANANARGAGGVSLAPSPLERAGVRTCLFGEHLLKDTSKSIAIVESEKTAIIASVYLPNFTWLACGSLTNLTKEKCQILSGRKVILYPDLKCFEKWNEKAKELSSITNFTVSDFLEKKATDPDKQSGLDLADYLIRFNHNSFVTPRVMLSGVEAPAPPLCVPANAQARGAGVSFLQKIISQAPNILDHFAFSTPTPIVIPRNEGSVFNSPLTIDASPSWNTTIQELESFFTSTQLPTTPIKINNHSTIIDVNKFIEGHLLTVKANNGNKTFLPYLERLIALKNMFIL